MAPLCVCYSCGSKMDCDPSGVCELCEGQMSRVVESSDVVIQSTVDNHGTYIPLDAICPDDRQVLNILQRLHQNILREDQPYVKYTNDCRWQFNQGVYKCEHVSVPEEEMLATHRMQMDN